MCFIGNTSCRALFTDDWFSGQIMVNQLILMSCCYRSYLVVVLYDY